MIDELTEKIKRIECNGQIHVSEHAIIRYFERVKGFDMEQIEKEILSAPIIDLIEKLGGSGSYPGEGYSVVMKDFTVITIKN